MKQLKTSNNVWQTKWEPSFAKPAKETVQENSMTQAEVRNVAYATQLQIAEKPSVSLDVPQVSWDTGKDWIVDSIVDNATGFKDYIKRKIYKPEGITVEQFSVALTKGAKYANTLLNRGYNINKQDHLGNTAFMLACQNFKRDWIDFLLDAGADVNIANNDKETPLMYICKNSSFEVKGKVPMVEDISKQEKEKLKEQNQARKDLAFDTFNTMIRIGAELNLHSNNGFNALIYAVRRGNTDIVQRAIELGANIDTITKEGATALDIAIENSYIMTSQLLFQLNNNQLKTLNQIQAKYPSNPRFVKFFEILYQNNLEEQNGQMAFLQTPDTVKNYSFLNKKM